MSQAKKKMKTATGASDLPVLRPNAAEVDIGEPKSTWPCLLIEILKRCGHSPHSQKISIGWQIGSPSAGSKRWRWQPPDPALLQPTRHLSKPAVQLPNSRTGCSSRPGGTATKWPALPISMPDAFPCTTSNPGSAKAICRCSSVRCLRFRSPSSNARTWTSFALPWHTHSVCVNQARLSRQLSSNSPAKLSLALCKTRSRHQIMNRHN